VRHFPYGEESTTTTQDRVKFASYYRDSGTALDYAQQRYYARTIGRFTSPDPYMASASLGSPQSWNRYAYVGNDPVNANDPSGLYMYYPSNDIAYYDPWQTAYDSASMMGYVQVWGYYPGETWASLFTIPASDLVYNEGNNVAIIGPPTAGQAAAQAVLDAAKNMVLLNYETLTPPCLGRIEALTNASGGMITLTSIIETAGKLTVYDGTDSSGFAGQVQFNDLYYNSPDYVAVTMAGWMVADRFAQYPGVNAETMLGLNQLGLAVMFIRPDAVNSNSTAYNTALVMHEVIHSLGFQDDFVKNALGIPLTSPSVNITKAFANDCFGVSK